VFKRRKVSGGKRAGEVKKRIQKKTGVVATGKKKMKEKKKGTKANEEKNRGRKQKRGSWVED